MANMPDSDLEGSEFELQSRDYIHFRANTGRSTDRGP